MHSFPWWGELLINAIVLLAHPWTWAVIVGAVAGLGYYFYNKRKNKLTNKI